MKRYFNKSFRGADPNAVPDPGAMNQYEPPSILAQHKGLAIAFVLVLIAVAVYFIKLPRATRHWPVRPEPVYIESLPDQQKPAAQP